MEAGYRGYFTSAADMVATVARAYADGTFATKIRTYTGPSVLVIDDVGLTGYNREEGNAFFQWSTAATTTAQRPSSRPNRSLPSWGELFGYPVVAAAILDRLLHHAAVINIKGLSWRLRQHQALVHDRQGVMP